MNQVTQIPYLGTMRMYRKMLKTMMKAFDGDPEMFHRVRLEVRKKVGEHKELTDPVEIQKQIFFAEDARSFLENNLIAGRLQENGRYRFKAKPQHSMVDPIKQ